MKIIYCAYGRAGKECLEKLFLNFNIDKSDILIFTHDLKANKEFIKYLCDKELNFFYDNVNNFYSEIKRFYPNYLLSVYYRNIVNIEIINLVDGKAMNLHPSLLPAYRGAMSSVWAILNKEFQTGVSFHYMNSSVDEGKLILQKSIPIKDEDTAYSLYHKLITLFVQNFIKAFKLLIDGYNGTEQLGLASYFSRNLPYNGKLNINEVSFEEALQFVKALYFPPYRGAIFVIDKNEEVEVKSIDDLKKIKEKS